MIWHEGYHHGQIKLALKAGGQTFEGEVIGRVTWDVWMDKHTSGTPVTSHRLALSDSVAVDFAKDQ